MARGGPHNKRPTYLKVLYGTARKDRENPHEPKPKPVAPQMPKGLNRYAREAWAYLAPRLERLGTLTEVDGPLFEAFVDTYGQWRKGIRLLRRMKPTDEAYRRVAVTVENARKDLRLIGAEFGIGAASRSRIEVKGETTQDDMEALLGS